MGAKYSVPSKAGNPTGKKHRQEKSKTDLSESTKLFPQEVDLLRVLIMK